LSAGFAAKKPQAFAESGLSSIDVVQYARCAGSVETTDNRAGYSSGPA
jgi:hypothetical protein